MKIVATRRTKHPENSPHVIVVTAIHRFEFVALLAPPMPTTARIERQDRGQPISSDAKYIGDLLMRQTRLDHHAKPLRLIRHRQSRHYQAGALHPDKP